ncbi:uncharacterized protein EV420DRAFT_670106 [Desarmillaria tabescens]|uniref:Uncharacterized protein n=1 Tax=Armillaria tabescens TaxID=1929756 RepID=A0AA39U511_ARMTA|nr:uncharacterized protein EV420DRAFT_670106 [Desarmillaria tabescens]KAK0467160.1 hypothetical protein EV420DRAFT_670106 [Desarmillaria tabescens]
MAGIQMYLKPRSVSAVYNHSNYLPFGCLYDCEYGPFFADYGTVPSDATEVYTIHSSAIRALLSTLFNELIPSLDAQIPDPTQFPRSAWPTLLQIAMAKVDSWFDFRIECENNLVQLTQGDHAPAPPPRKMRGSVFSPEWYNIVYSILLWDDVELRGDESQDTVLELYTLVYMYRAACQRARIWRLLRQKMDILLTASASAPSASSHSQGHSYIFSPLPFLQSVGYSGLFNFIRSKVLALVPTFTTQTTCEHKGLPPLPPSSSNGLSTTDSTSSLHADNVPPVLLHQFSGSSATDSMSSSYASHFDNTQRLFRVRFVIPYPPVLLTSI